MTAPAVNRAPTPGATRWVALGFLSLAQLMIALDTTVMNVALPSVQADLGFTDADRQWVITAYTLSFGALLLLGGRVADRIGRERALLIGLAGFAAASAATGTATGIATLAAFRAAQGAFAALLAPTVLSLLAVSFTAPKERAQAFAVFGAIAGSGGAAGLLLGGLLTQGPGWRACLLVNVPVAVIAAAGYRRARRTGPGGAGATAAAIDVPGALLATGGLVAVVLGCAQAAERGWLSVTVLGLLGAGVLLLGTFGVREARAPVPLLPLRILADRSRAGAYLAAAAGVAAMLGAFLLLTYFVQAVLGYDPVRAGLAFLPLSAAVIASSQLLAARLGPRVPPRALVVPGLLIAAAGMGLLTRLTADSGYLAGLLPAEILLGLGVGIVFTPAIGTATSGVAPRDAGVAAAVVNTAMQVGGSIGVAALNTVAATATATFRAGRPQAATAAALVHGYAAAATVATGVLVAGALLAAVLITADPRASHGHAHHAQEGSPR